MNNLHTACAIAGSKAKLARALGITPPMINHWISGFRPIPTWHCVSIERLTAGAVSRKDLRPNDWERIWPELGKKNRKKVKA